MCLFNTIFLIWVKKNFQIFQAYQKEIQNIILIAYVTVTTRETTLATFTDYLVLSPA